MKPDINTSTLCEQNFSSVTQHHTAELTEQELKDLEKRKEIDFFSQLKLKFHKIIDLNVIIFISIIMFV